MTTTPPPTLLRDRLIVTLAALIWIGGTLVGMGVIGGQGVAAQGEGLFSDSATLIAPHGPAFSIWPVIYVLLAAYVIWQWLPVAAASRWAEASRLPAAASLALNGLWLLSVYAGWLFVSVLVMIGIVASLAMVLRATSALRAEGLVTSSVVGGTYGLYLGWICVATCANIASWLVSLGVPAAGLLATILTVVVLVAVVGIIAHLLRRAGHRSFRIALVLAVVWGLAWVAVGRFTGELMSTAVGIAAVVAALAVALLGVVAATRNPAPLAPA